MLTEVPPAAGRPRGHPGRLIAILAVIAALTAGWPIASAAISGNRPLRAGELLSIGPDSAHRAELAVGPGWALQQSQSNPKTNYVLRNGGIRLSVVFVWLASRDQSAGLWTGLRQLLQAANESARLGQPVPVISSHGAAGQTARLRQDGQTGLATIYPAPPKTFAIEIISLGPPGALGPQAAARQVALSLRFPAAGS